ncbi:TPA: LysB family phage lysis regulatory protein, partial [Yersinia enterocolitica]|nr:LysB family phage lysis regulatory protein [Yersinia enterocolitica]
MRTLLLIWVLMMGLLAWHAHSLKKELDSAKTEIGTLSAGIESRDNVITRLQDEARQQADNERALRQSLSRAST